MDKQVSALLKELKPGYHVEPVPRRERSRGGYYYVLSPEGERALQPGGRPIVLHKADSPKSIARLRGQLVRSGAIAPPARSRTPRPAPVSEEAGKLPHVQAVEILRSDTASARERALAREVLRLREELEEARVETVRLREFAEAAAERLRSVR